MNYSDLTLVAIQAAMQAGELLRRGFGTLFQISSKEGVHNLVTEYDHLSENCIIAHILKTFPNHLFLAEETGSSQKGKSDVLWIIDPLDGTVNFAHHIPIFTVSIAVSYRSEIVSGVIYQPMTNELFIGEKNKGSFLNGNRLKVTDNDKFEKGLLATGFPYNVYQNPQHCIDSFIHLLKLGCPIRRLGSAALDLAYVAAGRFDAFWEVGLHPWDVAAGKLLVEEAGGKVTLHDDSSHPILGVNSILATNGALHQKMVAHL